MTDIDDKCPECGGTGEVVPSFSQRHGVQGGMTCPTCHGTGKSTPEEE